MIHKKIRIAFVLTSVLGFSCMGWNIPFSFAPQDTLAGLFDFGKQEVPVDPFLTVDSPLDTNPPGSSTQTNTSPSSAVNQAVDTRYHASYSTPANAVQPVSGTVSTQSSHTATAVSGTVASNGAIPTTGIVRANDANTATMTGVTGTYSLNSPVWTADQLNSSSSNAYNSANTLNNTYSAGRFSETASPTTSPATLPTTEYARFADSRFSRADNTEIAPVAPIEPIEMTGGSLETPTREANSPTVTPPPVPAALQSSVSDGNQASSEVSKKWPHLPTFRRPAFLDSPLTPPWKSAPSISQEELSRFASDPLSPTRVGQSPYGAPSNYDHPLELSTEQYYFLMRYFGASNPKELPSLASKSHETSTGSKDSLDDTSAVDTPSGSQLLDDFYTAGEWKSPWERLTSVFAVAPDHDKARTTYERGISLFREKKYKEAARAFKEASALWPDSAIQEDALFMRAESFFFADQYKAAYDEYCYLFKYYEFSRYTDVASRRMFLIAQYWEKYSRLHPEWTLTPNFFDATRPAFDTRGYAVKCYGSVRTYDPIGPLGDDAIMAAAGIHFADEKWVEAAREYKQLRTDYSQSEYLVKAHVLEVQSLCYQYQGLQYEITPLREAGKLIDQSLLQFGNELGEDREGLITTKREIVQSLARREFEIGKYYDSKGYYRAARIYYESVLLEYPTTDVAADAKQRLEEIREYPDTPTDHLAWIEEIFPKRK